MAKGLRERFILTRLYRDEKDIKIAFFVILGLVFVLILNIVYLNLVSFNNLRSVYLGEKSSRTVVFPTAVPTTVETPIPTVIRPIYQNSVSQTVGSKEYFIAFGSGSNSSTDWHDVSGAEATIDFSSYQNIKEIKFEVSVNVPTANEAVSVRLFNKTDQHPVWFSEVTMNGGDSSYLVSSPITYDKGSKTYQVQMKTQLNYTANLTQSRLHIVLN